MSEKKRLVSINLSEWELGKWPEDLFKAVSIERDKYSIDISIESDLFKEITRKIITEAIQEFLSSAVWTIQEDGLYCSTDDFDTNNFTISWDELEFRNHAAMEETQRRIVKQQKEWKDDE